MRNHRPRPHLADRADILKWADRMEARSEFPRLVRELIERNNDQLVEAEMRAAEGTGLPGYDGVTRAARGSPLVPQGLAVWELGTGIDPARKANEDYASRTADPLGRDPATTAFVFVTPREWREKQDWAMAKRAEGVWADVRAFDVDDIEQALIRAPAVHYRFSEVVGKPSHGAQSIEDWWARFCELSSPPLDADLVLAGRPDAAAELLRIFEGETRLTAIQAPSVDDVLAFVAASIMSSNDQTRADLLSRSLIVRDAYTLRTLDVEQGLLILIPFEDDLRRDALLVRSHHVVVRSEDGGGAGLTLSPVDSDEFTRLLLDREVPQERAQDLTRYARRSLLAFQRRASSPGSGRSPSWAERLDSRVARRGWLAGKWSERRSGDLDALAALFETTYDDAREELATLAGGADPLFIRVGETWAVVSVEEAWQYGQPRLQHSDLTAFEVLVQSVLGAVDPRLELPVADRWMADVYGKSRIHSSDLREGIADVLALLGARGETVTIGSATVGAWLRRTLWQLFNRANEDMSGQMWASLTDVLPLLAEAVPDVFLDAVQKGLEGDQPLLGLMFADREDDSSSLSVSSPHTGLLWALEGVAWSPEHFGLAVEQLARLAEVDPGGRLSNRPAASLASIYRSWLPQASVALDRRLRALDALRQRHPLAAWPLMLTMLPEHHAVGHYTHRPKYRDWKPEEETGRTSPEARESFLAAASRLVEDAAGDPDRWAQLTARFDDLPAESLDLAVERLSALAGEAEIRSAVWEPLQSLVRRHQRYSDTEWAMSAKRADRLAALAEQLAPADIVARHQWLFDDHLPDLPELAGEEFDSGRYMAAVADRRREAMAELIATDGLEGVVELAKSSSYPWFVGVAVSDAGADSVGQALLDHLDHDDNRLVVAATAWATQQGADDWDWILQSLGRFEARPLAAARLLLTSNDLDAAWTQAAASEAVDAAYWAEFTPYGRGQGFPQAEEASRKLIAHDRPRAGLMLMNLYAESVGIDRTLVVEGLERLVELPEDHPDQFRVDSYEIERLLEYARDGDIDEERLALLEWRLRPALGFEAQTPILERRLARHPEFFVEVLSLAFRPRNREPDRGVPSAVASNAYRLLDEWRHVPGSEVAGGDVDSEQLDAWVDSALALSTEADRLEIALDQIGKILAKAGADLDGSWPTRPVRDVIERVGRSELDEGFRVQIANSRGVMSRGLMEGGERERERSARYAQLADRVSDGWPRTAAALRLASEGFEADARYFDQQTERLREGLD